jgi:DNA repair protein RecN (Recombination protein N)
LLIELHIENLAVISHADLELANGLNVITGETGAGKTILAHAISLLLGARADTSLIRPGAPSASVEAVFSVPAGTFADLESSLDIPDDEFLVVRRHLSRDGRSRAYLGGHTVTLSVLEQLTGRLLKFSAQHEQRRLMMASHQLEILDAFGGRELIDLRDEYRILYERRAELLARLRDLNQDSEARGREAELLSFQVAEIEAAGLIPDEDLELDKERRRLLNALELKEAAAQLAACLGGEGADAEGMMDALSAVSARLEAAAGMDEDVDRITTRLKESFYELEETGRAARDYAEAAQEDPVRLAEVEERLDLISGLKRKYGATLAEVIDFSARASVRLEQLGGSEADRSADEAELAVIEKEALDLALALHSQREDAAAGLEDAAGAHLKDLAFRDCGFQVELTRTAGAADDGRLSPEMLGPSGADAVEFYVRLNPGMPAAPLRETASGGEMSRIMLAIKSAGIGGEEVATLVFDEVDAGIGGETGSAVGAKLRSLAGHSQIICITHLPQIACYSGAAGADAGRPEGQESLADSIAGAHFSVTKSSSGKETRTTVARLEAGGVVDELCRMMGSRPEDGEARAHAESLLAKAGAAV